MDASAQCADCGRALSGAVHFGLCAGCLVQSFVTTSGVFDPARLTPEAEQLRQNFRVGDGRFLLIESLGEGGMGQVWLAEDARLDRKQVALKFVRRSLGRDPRFIQELRQELIRTRDLQDRNIVKVHDWHEHGDEPPFISMEYVKGQPLSVLLQNHEQGLPYRRLHPLLLNVAQALVYAHAQGIIHRDLKPGNILTSQSGGTECAKLADFGIGHLVEEGTTAQRRLGGTLPYMSPAQAQGGVPCPADDIFALGATLYQLLTGVLPYGFEGCLHNDLTPLAETFGDERRSQAVPAPVRTLIWSCLQLQPGDRPESVAKILAVLRQHPTPENIVALPPRPTPLFRPIEPEPERGFSRRYALLFFVMISLALVYWKSTQPPEPPATTNITVVIARPIHHNTNAARSTLAVQFTNASPTLTLSNLVSGSSQTKLTQDGWVGFTNLPPGNYRLTATQTGFAPTTITLNLESDRTNRLWVGLTRLQGALSFKVPTETHRIYQPTFSLWSETEGRCLTNAPMGKPEMTISNVPTGAYELSVCWPGESVVTKPIRIEQDKKAVLGFSFGEVVANLTTLSAAEGSSIEAEVTWTNKSGICGRRSPVALAVLREGARMVTFKAEGFYEEVMNIVLVTNRSPTNLTVSLTRSTHPLPGDRFTNELGMGFCPLPDPASEPNIIWVGRTEVTRGQFQEFVRATKLEPKGMNCLTTNGVGPFSERNWFNPGFVVVTPEAHPVVGVSWTDAIKFCKWLTHVEQAAQRLLPNQSYTLPTGAQWQRACVLNNGSYTNGNFAGSELLKDQHWPLEWNALVEGRPNDAYSRTAPVESSDARGQSPEQSRFDVRNLFDNVQEWCLEEYRPGFNSNEVLHAYRSTLGTRRFTPDQPWRVVCGGSWFDHDPLLWQSTTRQCATENERTDYRGFRVVIVETPAENAP